MSDRRIDSIDPVAIGEQLARARNARGLTQQQAAEALGVARTTVTAMEKGDRRPRPSEIVQLAALYGRQVGDLLRAVIGGSGDSFVVQFRSARMPGDAARDSDIDADILGFQGLCMDYAELERLTNSPLPRRYPEVYDIRGSDPERAAEEVALSERNRLGLGDGPIGDLWSVLEADVGLRIFAPEFASRRLSGLFGYTEPLGGCIAVNASHPEERRILTAAHEYGHFLSDRYRAEITVLWTYRRVPESERFADAFALHFLMPEPGLVRRFHSMKRAKADGSITPADLLVLSQMYRVSFQSLMWRLEGLKLLQAGAWDKLKEAGFKTNAARDLVGLTPLVPERGLLPLRFEALAIEAFEAGELSEGRLARLLRTDRVSARRRIEEITGTQYFGEGEFEVRQLALDLDQRIAVSRV